MEMSFDRILGIVGVLGILIGVGVAIAMDPKSRGEMNFSVACFVFSGVALSLTIGIWAFKTNMLYVPRILLSAFLFAGVTVAMVEASRWANGRFEKAKALEDRKEIPELANEETHGTTDKVEAKNTSPSKAESPKPVFAPPASPGTAVLVQPGAKWNSNCDTVYAPNGTAVENRGEMTSKKLSVNTPSGCSEQEILSLEIASLLELTNHKNFYEARWTQIVSAALQHGLDPQVISDFASQPSLERKRKFLRKLKTSLSTH